MPSYISDQVQQQYQVCWSSLLSIPGVSIFTFGTSTAVVLVVPWGRTGREDTRDFLFDDCELVTTACPAGRLVQQLLRVGLENKIDHETETREVKNHVR